MRKHNKVILIVAKDAEDRERIASEVFRESDPDPENPERWRYKYSAGKSYIEQIQKGRLLFKFVTDPEPHLLEGFQYDGVWLSDRVKNRDVEDICEILGGEVLRV